MVTKEMVLERLSHAGGPDGEGNIVSLLQGRTMERMKAEDAGMAGATPKIIIE